MHRDNASMALAAKEGMEKRRKAGLMPEIMEGYDGKAFT